MSASDKSLPLVYSCSGCSSAAQMANHLAVQLDRRGIAEMSCIAGVGGNVRPLVRVAQSGRPILALDGCVLQCVKNSLAQHGVEPTTHVLLHELGVKKRYRTDFDPAEAEALFGQMEAAARALRTDGKPAAQQQKLKEAALTAQEESGQPQPEQCENAI